jgi:hypothetical protein
LIARIVHVLASGLLAQAGVGDLAAGQDSPPDSVAGTAPLQAHDGKVSRRRLPIVAAVGGCTRAVVLVELREEAKTVRLRLENQNAPGSCPSVAYNRCFEVKLAAPLGRKRVIDASSGRPVPRASDTYAPYQGGCSRLTPQRHVVAGRPRRG